MAVPKKCKHAGWLPWWLKSSSVLSMPARALAWALFFLTALPSHAAVAAAADSGGYLTWGANADSGSCPDARTFLWVEHAQGQSCMRYFGTSQIQEAPVVVVQLYGDRNRVMDLPPEEITNNTQQDQDAYADRRAERIGVPLIVLARPGTYGSSGDHANRRYLSEFLAIDAALDALRKRYGIGEFVLLGHSGGATAGGAMLTLGRDDIRCAVLSSGAYHYAARYALHRLSNQRSLGFNTRVERLLQHYDPVMHVDGVHGDALRQVFIVGDPRDTNTPFHLQVVFAWLLNSRGHHAEIIEMEAAPPAFHNIKGNGLLRKAGECARGHGSGARQSQIRP